jgi:hypothetical protein
MTNVRGTPVPDALINIEHVDLTTAVLDSLPDDETAQEERLPIGCDSSADRLWIRVRFDPSWYHQFGYPPDVSLLDIVARQTEQVLGPGR